MSSSSPSPGRRRPASLSDAVDAYEGVVVPISRSGRRGEMLPTRDAERLASRREVDTSDRPTPQERRTRRRRQRESWLRRNALSLAAISALVAVLAVGFALVQVLSHTAPGQSDPSATAAPAGTAAGRATVSSTSAPAGVVQNEAPTISTAGPREVKSSVKALDPNYTVQSGDSLAAIATRFNTTIQRIQQLNDLSNPRVLSIGQKLVIPPPLP